MEGSIFSKITGLLIQQFMDLLKVEELKLFIVVLKNLGKFPRRYLQNCCSFPEKPLLSTNWRDYWKFTNDDGADSFSHHG